MNRNKASLDLPNFHKPPVAPGNSSGGEVSSISYAMGASQIEPGPEQAALPLLPRSQRPSFSSHRNDANAALALDLLAEVEQAVVGWHEALRKLLLDIQKLYMSGPIVDGWLEAVSRETTQTALETQASVLRHGDPEQIAAYLNRLAQQSQANEMQQGTQYQLCSLDADGRLQCQLCPPEELGVISQAIARNQQLRQLVNQKQYLEARLKRAAEALEVTRKALDLNR